MRFIAVPVHSSPMGRSKLAMLQSYALLLVLVVRLWLRVAVIITLGIRFNSHVIKQKCNQLFSSGFMLYLDKKDLSVFLILMLILIK